MENFEEKCTKKQSKYEKLIKRNFLKMKDLMQNIKKKAKHFEESECILHFLDNFLKEDIINDMAQNMNVRKIQLFLKMFVHWLKEFSAEIKEKLLKKIY